MSMWLVQTLAVAAGLAVLAALAGLWSRAGARTRHALWLLVLLKLMMPPLVIVDWAEAPPPAPEVALATLPTPSPLPTPEPSPEPAPLPPPDLPLEAIAPPPAEPQPSPEPLPEPSPIAPEPFSPVPASAEPPAPEPIDVPAFVPSSVEEPIRRTEWIAPAFLAVWLIGSLAIAARQSYRLLRFQRQLGRETRENIFADVPQWLLDELADAARLLGVAGPRITRTALVDTPLVWCLGRPRLLLPDVLIDSLGRDAWRGILRHELAHLKRKDHWVARLELLGEVAWWWNPLFWLARMQIHKYAELCCDAWVIALDSDTPGRHAYAMALLSVCEHLSKPRPTPTLGLALGMGVGETDVPGSRSARTLERRLRMILEEPPARRTSRLALLAILLLGLVVIPIWLHERDRALIREIALLTTSLRPTPTPSLDVPPPPTTQIMLPETTPVPVQPELVTNAVLKSDTRPEAVEKKAKPLPAEEPPALGERMPAIPDDEPLPNVKPSPTAANQPEPPPPIDPPSFEDRPVPLRPDNEESRARAAYDKPITLELPEQPFRTMIRALSKYTGLTFVLDPRSKEKLDQNVQFRGYGRSVEYALQSILQKLELRATMDENGILLISDRPQPIPLKVQLPEVIEPTSSVNPPGLPDAAKPSHLEPIETPYKRIQLLDASSGAMSLDVLRKPLPKSFKVEEETLTEALRSLSKAVGYEILPHQSIRERTDRTIVNFESQGRSLAQELSSLISGYECWFNIGPEGIIWVHGRSSGEMRDPQRERRMAVVLRALAEPIDLNSDEVPLKRALAEVTSKTGVPVAFDTQLPDIVLNQNVSINARQVKLRAALGMLLTPLQLSYRIGNGDILITLRRTPITSDSAVPSPTIAKNPDVPSPDFPGVEMYRKLQTPIDLDIKDLPLDRVVRTIQAQTGVDIIFNPSVKDIESKTATLQAKGIKLASALNMVLSQHNLTFTADDKRITIAAGSASPTVVASSEVPIPLALPDPDAPAFPAPMPSEPNPNPPTPPPPTPNATPTPSPVPAPVPAPAAQKPSRRVPSGVRPSPSSPAAKPPEPTLPQSPLELDPGPERPMGRRSPFDLDNQTLAEKGGADDLPALPGRRSPFALDEPGSRVRESESREVLTIQIRRAKASLATAEAQEHQASSELARWYRLHPKEGGFEPVPGSRPDPSPACEKLETQLKVAQSQLELKKADVAEAEARLKEFDRRRARDLAKLKLAIAFAKKTFEQAKTLHDRGVIPEAEYRKAEQALKELEIQLQYDFGESPQDGLKMIIPGHAPQGDEKT